jgi:hypothetical protein
LENRERAPYEKEGLPARRPLATYNGVINTGTAIVIPSAPTSNTNTSFDDSDYQTSFYESEYDKENIYFGKAAPMLGARPPSRNY